MLYLIGGSAKSGKTYLSNKLFKEYDIPLFSTDFLLWSLSGKGEFMYNDPDKEVSLKLEKYITPIVDYIMWSEDDEIIEGTHITVSLVNKLKEKYKDNIRVCFLGYSESLSHIKYEEIIKHEEFTTNKWYHVLSKDEFLKFLDSKINESKELREECERYGYKYFEIKDITKDSNKIINYLINNKED